MRHIAKTSLGLLAGLSIYAPVLAHEGHGLSPSLIHTLSHNAGTIALVLIVGIVGKILLGKYLGRSKP